ncbi:D-alanyl-D-alanine carboxypeptidase (penicillin-binding protein 5/6) [Cribrihabitans marinus]|uniref:serine-type D-Ala-D-Ala carboxypeptidase n=2 Tax=Cribrihabitans marinus TaxID=1227549 RepID=A0A1H6U915_9RHOB|nr:D-alanyl-D-alanine carboxypeptidase family protein [Cribrihabitans marinus]GGH21230.1 D-alanyl-D-alanine carboxypeptidase [Cribrihabitans marinus]SEI84372.1 D-alanyl-D-alanine carboxypeptidase (penicillin-binding protein 5/6) [Cribrihabitans marinus]
MFASLRSTALALGMLLGATPVLAFETTAGAAYVVDAGTGTVLLAKNPDEPLPPASMSKLMTLYMLFDALRDGRVALDEPFTVSSRARSMGGSTMFLNEQDRPTAEELIQGIIVSSGNDATVVVAEGLAGSEDAFARQMTEMAKQLGMQNSTFSNASGWPHPYQRMSVRDLGILAEHLIEEFPEYYGYFAQKEYDYKDRSPANRFNRNPLLGLGIGADGLKTGHTQEAGYGLVGSAKQGDRRVVFVLTGLDSQAARSEEAQAIVNWSFRHFVEKTVATPDAPVVQAEVWMGAQRTVGLVPPAPLNVLLPALNDKTVEAEVVYEGPINAPVKTGDQLAELVLKPEGLPEIRRPLVAAEDVPLGGFVVRMKTAANLLFDKFINAPAEAS